MQCRLFRARKWLRSLNELLTVVLTATAYEEIILGEVTLFGSIMVHGVRFWLKHRGNDVYVIVFTKIIRTWT